ncbi:hypothetical protein IC188_004298 [Salmonella enterica]|nr:hypothetical protein [Salmonella enterica]
MKKLIIAAGIAAATMASFGVNAAPVTASGNPSNASLNTIVKGTTGLSITATVVNALTPTQFMTETTKLGSFTVVIPQEIVSHGLAVGDIHAHNYPAGYKIKIKDNASTNNCTAELAEGGNPATNFSSASSTLNGYQCFFPSDEKTITLDVTNNGTTGSAEPGVRTITAQFVAYTN